MLLHQSAELGENGVDFADDLLGIFFFEDVRFVD